MAKPSPDLDFFSSSRKRPLEDSGDGNSDETVRISDLPTAEKISALDPPEPDDSDEIVLIETKP